MSMQSAANWSFFVTEYGYTTEGRYKAEKTKLGAAKGVVVR